MDIHRRLGAVQPKADKFGQRGEGVRKVQNFADIINVCSIADLSRYRVVQKTGQEERYLSLQFVEI